MTFIITWLVSLLLTQLLLPYFISGVTELNKFVIRLPKQLNRFVGISWLLVQMELFAYGQKNEDMIAVKSEKWFEYTLWQWFDKVFAPIFWYTCLYNIYSHQIRDKGCQPNSWTIYTFVVKLSLITKIL